MFVVLTVLIGSLGFRFGGYACSLATVMNFLAKIGFSGQRRNASNYLAASQDGIEQKL